MNLNLLETVSTANISDAMDKLNLDGILEGIKLQNNMNMKIYGKAITVQFTDIIIENPMPLAIDAISKANEDNIIIMTSNGNLEVAIWGGILSTSAKLKGIQGTILDGVCRDIDEIDEINYPMFSRGVAIKSPRNRLYQVSVNDQIQINNIIINPEDLIVADSNGVVVIPKEKIEEVITLTIEIAKLEKQIVDNLESGEAVDESGEFKYMDFLNLKD
ncbi:MAG: hypothetical protein OEZ01_03910 [Candidatus Heimdallarchaeota archaeon]|nr:hypothetical protein [Candidatus Heimdallarchaeota archaeon]MDH5645124.1 hypothetical protein [Candidatus Heimdallarchaeota archaeon]